ncbi:MAG: hypothetical protein ACLT3L_00065 [Clostridium sp.]|nr:hypothetical protein [Clostridium sp.]
MRSYDITIDGSVSESKKYFELIRYWTIVKLFEKIKRSGTDEE